MAVTVLDAGEIYWADLDPTLGHEQSLGRLGACRWIC